MGRFIIRRGLKIWPSYYVLMVVTAVFSLLVARARGVAFPKHEVLVSALFTRIFFGNDGFNYLSHSWSLAVEEHFYLLLPLLLVLLLRFGKRRDPFRSIPWIFLGVAAVCFALRYIAPQNGPYAWATYLRMDGLFAGVLIGYLYHFRRSWFDKLTGHHAPGICVLCLLPAFTFSAESEPMKTYGISLLMIGFSFLVSWSVVRQPRGRIASVMAKIGFYSYSIYLWHLCLAFPFVCPSSRALRWLSGSRWFWPSRSGL